MYGSASRGSLRSFVADLARPDHSADTLNFAGTAIGWVMAEMAILMTVSSCCCRRLPDAG